MIDSIRTAYCSGWTYVYAVTSGSNNDIHVSTIDFSTSPPSLSRFDAQLNGACVTAIQVGSGAGGAVLGTSVKLFGATNNAGKT